MHNLNGKIPLENQWENIHNKIKDKLIIGHSIKSDFEAIERTICHSWRKSFTYNLYDICERDSKN